MFDDGIRYVNQQNSEKSQMHYIKLPSLSPSTYRTTDPTHPPSVRCRSVFRFLVIVFLDSVSSKPERKRFRFSRERCVFPLDTRTMRPKVFYYYYYYYYHRFKSALRTYRLRAKIIIWYACSTGMSRIAMAGLGNVFYTVLLMTNIQNAISKSSSKDLTIYVCVRHY
jgi:hypothetical protein